MKCLNCGSNETYRKSPHDLIVHCDRCSYSWPAKQPLAPLLHTKVYVSRGSMKGQHNVAVWYCPVDQSRYSFSLTYGAGVCQFKEWKDDPYLSGRYNTPQEALEAGIREVKNYK